MAMRILITGAGGQLGREFARLLTRAPALTAPEVMALDRGGCDLASPDHMRAMVRDAAPEIVLNCAAYTDVNGAESDRAAAFAVNAVAPGVLAEECARLGALLVHFSTDYVFDGSQHAAYVEDDAPAPLNVYGASKLAGEQAIARSRCRHYIFRTSWVYSAHGKNFVRTMLRLGQERVTLRVVQDQVGAPTSTAQLADAVTRVLAEGREAASGVYHLTAQGAVSWCGFAQRIFDRAGHEAKLKVREVVGVESGEFVTAAVRPLNSRLNNETFRSTFGFMAGRWEEALDRVLEEMSLIEQVHAAS